MTYPIAASLINLFAFCEESIQLQQLNKAGFGICLSRDNSPEFPNQILLGKSAHYNQSDFRTDRPCISTKITFDDNKLYFNTEFSGIREFGKVKPSESKIFEITGTDDLKVFFNEIKPVYLDQISTKHHFKHFKNDFFTFLAIIRDLLPQRI